MMDRLTIRNPYGQACSYGACKDIKCSGDCEVCPVNRLIERLAAYEDAEEAGLLVKLPCKVGEMVYIIAFDDCFKGKCPLLADGKCTRPDYCPMEVIPWTFDLKQFESGPKFYLSKEEAEAKIRMIKEERNCGQTDDR